MAKKPKRKKAAKKRAPGGKRTSAKFAVILWAHARDDETPWAEKLRAIRKRLGAGR